MKKIIIALSFFALSLNASQQISNTQLILMIEKNSLPENLVGYVSNLKEINKKLVKLNENSEYILLESKDSDFLVKIEKNTNFYAVKIIK